MQGLGSACLDSCSVTQGFVERGGTGDVDGKNWLRFRLRVFSVGSVEMVSVNVKVKVLGFETQSLKRDI